MENQEPGIPAENADQVVTSDRKRTDASPQAILEGRDVGQSDGEDSQVSPPLSSLCIHTRETEGSIFS